MSEEQARIVSTACEFYARIRMGQFAEIIDHTIMAEADTKNFIDRREEAIRLLLEARKQLYPELHGVGHSYGIGKFKDADMAFDVYQVIRHDVFGDPRFPMAWGGEDLPTCEKV